jgi:hypothetical protein
MYLWLEFEIEQELVLPPKLRELRCYSNEYDNSKFMIKINGNGITEAMLEVVELPARSLLACPEALLTNVRRLTCMVEAEEVCDVLRLASRLSLESLRLESSDVTTAEMLRVFCAWSSSSSSSALRVKSLDLPSGHLSGASDEWSWLQTFPCLTELEVGLKRDGTADARYLEAFKTCRRLESLVDRSDDYVYHATCPLPASIIERAQYSFEDNVTVGRTQDGRLIKRCGGSTSELGVNSSSNLA